jgi:transcriptional regulator with GAF, ATPase, and Fis domain
MKPIDCQKILRDLSRFEAAISAQLLIKSVAEAALNFVERHLRLPYASLVLYDVKGKSLRLLATAGGDNFASVPFRLGNKMNLAGLAIETCEMVYCRDVSRPERRSDALVRRLPKEIRSIAVLPLQARDSVLGTFNIGSHRVDGIAPRHQAFFEAAAPRLAACLRNAQVFEELTSARQRLQQECDLRQSALSRSVAQLKQEVEERKKVENILQRSRGELEVEVAKRTAEIRKLQERLQAENIYLKEELAGANAYGEIIGESPALQEATARIGLVAPTNANVLILGESGTGKELIARAIHRHSGRRERPLIKVNCATVPKELYESEFFGHVKGAFTGAVGDRIGRFDAADGGTLFLDEVGEIPLSLQGKLLRVLQEGEFERVGEGRTRKVDVRIIAATNKNLPEEVRAGRFREDLYYRLNVFPIEIIPLREHKQDIPLLAAHFTAELSKRLNRPAPQLTKANLMDLTAHDWPGNVRELQNVIERALILSPSGKLRFDLPQINGEVLAAGRSLSGTSGNPAAPILTEAEVKALQKQNMLAALIRSDWKIYGKNGAAHLLGIKPTTLIERMRSLRIKKPG